jgi:glycosyltransferase involved in cell wall biosynthesis
MRILIDAKNIALYKGGISHWVGHQLQNWFAFTKEIHQFALLYPIGSNLNEVDLIGAGQEPLSWPQYLPRKLRHIWYDNFLFPKTVKKLHPDFLFSPYHDVRLPKKSKGIYTVITVHDLCFIDAPQAYPLFIRIYYLWMLRINLARANHVITISESTKERLSQEFNFPLENLSIVPNSIETAFLESIPNSGELQGWRNQNGYLGGKILLYSSGIDHRKNIDRLLEAMRLLWANGYNFGLCITGNLDSRWRHLFKEEELSSGKVKFLGYLSLSQLRLAYQAADAVVYPSLCEGFGRACIEAIACGTPLACSDLPVFHEVAGNNASYFDPSDIKAMSKAIYLALEQNRKIPYLDPRYELKETQRQFVQTMNKLLAECEALA